MYHLLDELGARPVDVASELTASCRDCRVGRESTDRASYRATADSADLAAAHARRGSAAPRLSLRRAQLPGSANALPRPDRRADAIVSR